MSDIQRDREERQHVIEVLKSWDGYFIGYTSDEVQEALRYAIASIRTDLKYDLLYEETSGQADKPTTKNDLAVDCISRKAVLDAIDSKTWEFCDYLISKGRNDEQKPVSHFADNLRECVREEMTSVTPQEPRKGHWIPIYQGDEIIDYRCSECEFGNTFGKGTFGMNFCPRCGSDNREVEE